MELEVSLVRIHCGEGSITFARIERKTLVKSSQMRAPCVAYTEAETEWEEDQMARSSA